MEDLTPEKLYALRNDVIALEAAAALAYDHLYNGYANGETPTWDSTDARNGIAHAMSSITPLYIVSPDKTVFKRLALHDLRGGIFREAGAVLQFSDGRPEISGLCVQSSAIAETIAHLKQLRALLKDLATDYCERRRAPPAVGGSRSA
jgi:hypothetical protein